LTPVFVVDLRAVFGGDEAHTRMKTRVELRIY
jgi:hypothetical protein